MKSNAVQSPPTHQSSIDLINRTRGTWCNLWCTHGPIPKRTGGELFRSVYELKILRMSRNAYISFTLRIIVIKFFV